MLEKLRFRARLMMFAAVIWVNGVVAAQDGFFFDVGADYLSRNIAANENFAIPALLGGHAALGVSVKRLDLSAEAGVSGSGEGSHPDFNNVMTSVSGVQIPLSLRGSVNILPPSSVQLRPEVSVGGVWTNENLLVRNLAYTETISDWAFVAGGGLRLSFGAGNGVAALYAGAFIDYRFDIADFSDTERQSSNFQIKAGVTIHPQGSGGYTGSTAKRPKARPMNTPNGNTSRGNESRAYAPPPTEILGGGIDGLLLNVLRGGQTQTGSTVDAPKLLSVLRQDAPAKPVTPGQPRIAQTSAVEQPKVAQTPAAKPQTVAPPAQQPIPNQEIPAMKPEQAITTRDNLEQERLEIAAMKAEIEKQKTALAAENTGVVRSTTTINQYTLEDNKLDTIYYGPNETKEPLLYSVPTLDAVGKKLTENSELMVTVRGYAAAAGTPAGQREISEKRAKYCADYLIDRYRIRKDRIVVEWFGASKKPETANGHEGKTLERAVELIVSPRTTQISGRE
ncbi:hypothetical protein AGMMS50267_00250 [Spirochaetia bacterium]|nr:hypothetical protein AGMMS50267_00250 [Spirochaetia bacterium]